MEKVVAKGSITVTLDSVRKDRNKHEYRMVPRVQILGFGIEEVGDGMIITKALEQLREQLDSDNYMLYIERDGKLVFNRMLLSEWFKKNPQPEHLRKDNLNV